MSNLLQLEIPILQRLALDVYDDMDYRWSCPDPIHIAEALGLSVQMTEGEGALIENVLRVPAIPSRREAGLVCYRLVAKHMLRQDRSSFWSGEAETRLTDALVMPRRLARKVPIEALPDVQAWAPVNFVERIYCSYPDRGEQVIPDEPKQKAIGAIVVPFKPRTPRRPPGSLRSAL
jgi:hypothetical protein